MSDIPVWLVTGCSSGLGKALAERVLARGLRAVVTARRPEQLAELVAGADDRALAVALDVDDSKQIASVVEAAKGRFGRIDVLVNNAGYGYQSTVEEGDEAEIRAQFDTNVFGVFAITRAVLPIMRAQRGGNIINVTSVAGMIGFPGSGYYAASKHAIEGWSDSLREEVSPLGIGVTCVEPGPFRTDWAGRSLRQTPNQIGDYGDVVGARLAGTRASSGTQAGDPLRAGDAMIDITTKPNPPRHLVLGAFGFDAVTRKLEERLEAIRGLRGTSVSADFPKS